MQNFGLLILRVIPASFMLFSHGLPKLMDFSEKMNTFPDPIGLGSPIAMALAIGAEVGCSILLILGVATRLACVPLIITMLVAGFVIHGADPFGKQEFALLYATVFAALFCLGTDRFGLGKIISKNRWMQ